MLWLSVFEYFFEIFIRTASSSKAMGFRAHPIFRDDIHSGIVNLSRLPIIFGYRTAIWAAGLSSSFPHRRALLIYRTILIRPAAANPFTGICRITFLPAAILFRPLSEAGIVYSYRIMMFM